MKTSTSRLCISLITAVCLCYSAPIYAQLVEIEKDGKTYLVQQEEATDISSSILYTTTEALGASLISNLILNQQSTRQSGRIFDILLWLETYEKTITKSSHKKIINLSQKMIVQNKKAEPIGYIHLQTPIIQEKEAVPLLLTKEEAKEVEEKKAKLPTLPIGIGTDRIDHSEVRDTWIQWTNELRSNRNLPPYIHHPALSMTSLTRSQDLSDKGIADHKRTIQSPYYDYTAIEKRFEDQGVTFINNNRATFTENIGRSSYSCDQEDCTQEAITAIRRIFDYFVSEQSTNGVHWRTLIHPGFQEIGVELTIDSTGSKLYAVMHYAVETVVH